MKNETSVSEVLNCVTSKINQLLCFFISEVAHNNTHEGVNFHNRTMCSGDQAHTLVKVTIRREVTEVSFVITVDFDVIVWWTRHRRPEFQATQANVAGVGNVVVDI